MPILLFLIVFFLSGCDSGQVSSFLHSPGAKKLAAQVGDAVLKLPDMPHVPSHHSSVKPESSFELVNGKNAVGHRDFASAKRVLPNVFAGMEEDFYCGCHYAGKDVNFASCGYVPRKNENRASRIEWEHVVPAWVLGHQRQCWQDGGRKECTENDPVFQAAEGDLNNLVPAVGEVNGDRSNFAYSAWAKNPNPIYGACRTVVDFKLKRVQPREEVRGRAARITLYMYQTYGLDMSRQDKQLMCAWAKTYPVDDWERNRNERIIRWQGSGNPLVTDLAQIDVACA